MSREAGRSIGALAGLATGSLAMWLLGYGGVIPLFLFGVGGTLAGAIIGERMTGQQIPGGLTRSQSETKRDE
jgi:uncharacterized membrane protein YccC